MTTETFDISSLLKSIDETVVQLLEQMDSLNEDKVNVVPYPGSWTAAQLFRHVIKSTRGMTKAMEMPGKPADRDPGARIPDLKNAFLDFSTKLQSPEFIVPEPGPYEKEAIMEDLKTSFEKFKKLVQVTDLSGFIEGLPLGPITKLEVLHFVLFHTTRYLHQMHKIVDALNES
jgi:hypothetical protein